MGLVTRDARISCDVDIAYTTQHWEFQNAHSRGFATHIQK